MYRMYIRRNQRIKIFFYKSELIIKRNCVDYEVMKIIYIRENRLQGENSLIVGCL